MMTLSLAATLIDPNFHKNYEILPDVDMDSKELLQRDYHLVSELPLRWIPLPCQLHDVYDKHQHCQQLHNILEVWSRMQNKAPLYSGN